jgi:hypothetical protein
MRQGQLYPTNNLPKWRPKRLNALKVRGRGAPAA